MCLYLTVGEGHAFASQLIMGSVKRGEKLIAILGNWGLQFVCVLQSVYDQRRNKHDPENRHKTPEHCAMNRGHTLKIRDEKDKHEL